MGNSGSVWWCLWWVTCFYCLTLYAKKVELFFLLWSHYSGANYEVQELPQGVLCSEIPFYLFFYLRAIQSTNRLIFIVPLWRLEFLNHPIEYPSGISSGTLSTPTSQPLWRDECFVSLDSHPPLFLLVVLGCMKWNFAVNAGMFLCFLFCVNGYFSSLLYHALFLFLLVLFDWCCNLICKKQWQHGSSSLLDDF